ncbi:hypothetical protein BV898_04536 [Hypsibius exemplaris]|uniref:Uncharacterized protein n=1 Tax=Hypsibius exemplaris TaxID=2072580 RepID=A0A1W0X2A0_HYPEX|nr:hypothetical protein BV898_04536 [Hypsibius exemplaris]
MKHCVKIYSLTKVSTHFIIAAMASLPLQEKFQARWKITDETEEKVQLFFPAEPFLDLQPLPPAERSTVAVDHLLRELPGDHV